MRTSQYYMNPVNLVDMLGHGAYLEKPEGGRRTEPGDAVTLTGRGGLKTIEIKDTHGVVFSSIVGHQVVKWADNRRDNDWVYQHCSSEFPYVVKDPDFGTYRSWLHMDRDEIDRQDIFELVRLLMQYTSFFDGDDMQPLKDYTVSWLVNALRRAIT